MTDYQVVLGTSIHRRSSDAPLKMRGLNCYYGSALTPEAALAVVLKKKRYGTVAEVWDVHDDDGREHLIHCGSFRKMVDGRFQPV